MIGLYKHDGCVKFMHYEQPVTVIIDDDISCDGVVDAVESVHTVSFKSEADIRVIAHEAYHLFFIMLSSIYYGDYKTKLLPLTEEVYAYSYTDLLDALLGAYLKLGGRVYYGDDLIIPPGSGCADPSADDSDGCDEGHDDDK